MNKKYKWLLFDLDNTLLDFDETSKIAFKHAFLDKNLPYDSSLYPIYHEINLRLWKALERQEITKEAIRAERFRQFFEKMELDYDAEYFSRAYLENLVTHSIVYEGVPELLKTLKQKYRLSIITNGLKEVQRPKLKLNQITDFFEVIVVSDEIGHFKPTTGIFEYIFKEMGKPLKAETLILGDSLSSDIKGGHDFGIDTCWVNLKNKTNETSIQPTFEINHLKDLYEIL